MSQHEAQAWVSLERRRDLQRNVFDDIQFWGIGLGFISN